MVDREDVERAIIQAEDAVTYAIRSGTRPDAADLLLLQHWKRKKTIRDRFRDSAFPLLVVAVAMLFMTLMATQRPPVTKVEGRLLTTAVELEISEVEPQDALLLQRVNKMTAFRAFGFATARLGACHLNVAGQGIQFQGSHLQVPLSRGGGLRLEVTRHAPSVSDPDATMSLFAEITTDAVVDAFDVSGAGPTSGSAPCVETGVLSLDPVGTKKIEVTAPQIPAVAFPNFLDLRSIWVSRMTFGRRDGNGPPERCALTEGRLSWSQDIRILGVSKTTTKELSKGTCIDITKGNANVYLTPTAEGSISVKFSAASDARLNIDDGFPAKHITPTYLEILTDDPDVTLIIGAIAFILTTVWSAAAVLKEIVAQ